MPITRPPHRSQSIITIALSVFTVLVAAGCSNSSSPPDAETVELGAVLALSGKASFIGRPEAEILQTLVDQVNRDRTWTGPKFDLTILDSGGDPNRAMAHVETLMSKGVLAVIGPSTSGESLAVRGLAQSYETPLVSLAASHKIVANPTKWVFKTAQSDALAVQAICTDMISGGISKIALLFAADGFGESGAEQWRQLAGRYSITIIEEEAFHPEDTNLSGVVGRLLAKEPQALVIWGTSPGPAEATRAARAQGFGKPIYQSHGVASEKFIELSGEAANGVRLPASKLLVLEELPETDVQRSELRRYVELHTSPSHFGGHAWDAFHLIKEAVQDGATTRPKLRDALESRGEFIGITGVFNWTASDHEGLDASSFAIVEIRDGEWGIAREPPRELLGE